MVIREAHALGLNVTVNIESLAHIINRASGAGIGGGGDALILSGNLPPPTLKQVLAFVDEVIATGADAISAEAYDPEYDKAIADHLVGKGVPYVHTGADRGTTWSGYYYSFYPDDPEVEQVYSFLHSNCAVLGTTNALVFARARAVAARPETAVVVGAYNPFPCDTRLSLADVFGSDRPLPIDETNPTLDDGTVVANCATGPWMNLLLVAARRQEIDRIWLTADMPESVAASSRDGIGRDILARIAAHPSPETSLPVANIIIDLPEFTDDDGYSNDDFFEAVSLGIVGVIDDALQAAGYQTVLTYDEPWTGGEAGLTYILTAGGNEETEDGGGMGPPYWSTAQDLPRDLVALLDTSTKFAPVFIHPVFGVPEAGAWKEVRSRFGLPSRFAHRNPKLTSSQGYQTSLLTSLPVTADGDVPDDAPHEPIMPETATVLGHDVRLRTYTDFFGIGAVANYVAEGEVPRQGIVAEGPLLVTSEGATQERNAPYLVTDGQGRFLWLVNQMHHEAFTFIVGQAIAQATGRPAALAAPTRSHVWSGTQTFALAYDKTSVSLQLPFIEGQSIDVTIYDLNGEVTRQDTGVGYSSPLNVSLDKYSLLVVEPAR